MLETFDFYISYSQLIIFDNELEAPFNDWRPEHVAQGFSWREGSVAFSTLEDNGNMRVEVVKTTDFKVDLKASIAIVVPFIVKDTSQLGISDTVNESRISIVPEGSYALVYETGYNENDSMWFRLTFTPERDVQPKILLNRDNFLRPSFPLLMEAEPA